LVDTKYKNPQQANQWGENMLKIETKGKRVERKKLILAS
jgi:hypothetical protein